MQDCFATSRWRPGAQWGILTLRMTSPASASAPRNMRSWLHQVSVKWLHWYYCLNDDHWNKHLILSQPTAVFTPRLLCLFLCRERLSADSHPEPMWIASGHFHESQLLSQGCALTRQNIFFPLCSSLYCTIPPFLLGTQVCCLNLHDELFVLPYVFFLCVDTE